MVYGAKGMGWWGSARCVAPCKTSRIDCNETWDCFTFPKAYFYLYSRLLSWQAYIGMSQCSQAAYEWNKMNSCWLKTSKTCRRLSKFCFCFGKFLLSWISSEVEGVWSFRIFDSDIRIFNLDIQIYANLCKLYANCSLCMQICKNVVLVRYSQF